MTTNLIFKRQKTIDGVITTQTKIVQVDIPHIQSGEGWLLSGHTDTVEIITKDCGKEDTGPVEDPVFTGNTKVNNTNITKFQSKTMGTAKLVRTKGIIKVVARRGKTTYNQTTPNSVCIPDHLKIKFFNECRLYHGNTGIYEFKLSDDKEYNYWSNIIDVEYQRQRHEYIRETDSKGN